VLVFLIQVSISGAAPFAYITNYHSNNVSVIDTATNNVVTSVSIGPFPSGIAVTPDGTKVYVTNQWDNNVSVIDTVTNKVPLQKIWLFQKIIKNNHNSES